MDRVSGEGVAGQGYRAKKRNGWTVRAIILISDILYHPYIHYYKLSSKKIFHTLPGYGL